MDSCAAWSGTVATTLEHPMLWLKIKDLETLARFLESTDLLSDTQTPGRL